VVLKKQRVKNKVGVRFGLSGIAFLVYFLSGWNEKRPLGFPAGATGPKAQPTRSLHNAGLTGPELLFVCRLNVKRPLGFRAGAIPTVDFLLAHPATIVKKKGVKTHDRSHSKISAAQVASPAGPTGPKTQDGRAKLSNAAAISARVQTPAI
jgi:hypothetical protein